ncbi:MAG: thiamine pyrophosphate-binding protein [Terriglobia bacterium]
MRLTGAEIVVEWLIREKVPYLVGIPGHGNVPLFDALLDRKEKIAPFPVMHEQCAVHLADAYHRVCGQPLAVTTSIGPGAANTTCGVAQAYVDSSAVLVITGSVHTYMRGHSVLQEIDRTHWANFPRVLEPVVKQWWQPSRVDQLPFVLQRAFNSMLTGRRGPVLIDLPMDIQAESAEVELPEVSRHRPLRGPGGHPEDIDLAAELLAGAKRPVMLLGGGAVTAHAADEVRKLAESLGAAVVTTWSGQGIFPEDHELYAWHPGSIGSLSANQLCQNTDVLLAVGTRFVDWTTASYTPDVYRIPPTKLIHIDLDVREIGKNYPVDVGICADAKVALGQLLEAVGERLKKPRDYRSSPYFAEISRVREAFFDSFRERRESDAAPVSISRALAEIRKVAPRDSIWVTGAGLPQSQVYQEVPFYEPRTHITSGGFSTMGFTVPGAIGAQLAAPRRRVLGVAGDGDFLASMQELAVAAQKKLPILYVVMNNGGWQSIRNLQMGEYGQDRIINTVFETTRGEPYSPNFAAVARAFGVKGWRTEKPADVGPIVRQALESGETCVVELLTARELPLGGLSKYGWWDVPVPEYLKERREKYEEARKKVKV